MAQMAEALQHTLEALEFSKGHDKYFCLLHEYQRGLGVWCLGLAFSLPDSAILLELLKPWARLQALYALLCGSLEFCTTSYPACLLAITLTVCKCCPDPLAGSLKISEVGLLVLLRRRSVSKSAYCGWYLLVRTTKWGGGGVCKAVRSKVDCVKGPNRSSCCFFQAHLTTTTTVTTTKTTTASTSCS